jgi:hypothetical protein
MNSGVSPLIFTPSKTMGWRMALKLLSISGRLSRTVLAARDHVLVIGTGGAQTRWIPLTTILFSVCTPSLSTTVWRNVPTKNRPIGQAEFASPDASAYTGLAAILAACRLLLRFLKMRTGQESRGGEGMSDTAIWPRPVFLPCNIDYLLDLTLTCRTRCHE